MTNPAVSISAETAMTQEPRMVVISEQAANTLLVVARQVQIADASGKVRVGVAQLELEEGLNKLQVAKTTSETGVKTDADAAG